MESDEVMQDEVMRCAAAVIEWLRGQLGADMVPHDTTPIPGSQRSFCVPLRHGHSYGGRSNPDSRFLRWHRDLSLTLRGPFSIGGWHIFRPTLVRRIDFTTYRLLSFTLIQTDLIQPIKPTVDRSWHVGVDKGMADPIQATLRAYESRDEDWREFIEAYGPLWTMNIREGLQDLRWLGPGVPCNRVYVPTYCEGWERCVEDDAA